MRQKITFALWVIIVTVFAIFAGFIGALALIPRLTTSLFFYIIFILLLVFGVAFALLILPARKRFQKPRQTAALLAGLPVLLLVILYGLPNLVNLARPTYPVDDDLLTALEAHTHSLPSVDSFELDLLRPSLAGRQVVALGEATHGTSEFFRLKHSVIAYLVTELGFRNYGMEISPADGEFLNRYIHGEDVDPAAVLYWPWATEEVLAMLNWMRAYNAGVEAADQLMLYGIDPREADRDRIMAENVSQIVAAQGPIVLWAHNAHIWAKEGAMGSYLRDTFGSDAYLLGFEFSQGTFTSRSGQVDTFTVGAAPPTFYAHALAQLDSPLLFLDMAEMQQEPLLAEWLNTPQLTHNLAEVYHVARLMPGSRTAYVPLPDLYDGLIFVEESTPAVILPGVG